MGKTRYYWLESGCHAGYRILPGTIGTAIWYCYLPLPTTVEPDLIATEIVVFPSNFSRNQNHENLTIAIL